MYRQFLHNVGHKHRMDHVEFHLDRAYESFHAENPSGYHHLNRQYKGMDEQMCLLNGKHP